MHLRIALITILGVLLVALAFDVAARFQAKAAFNKVNARIPSEETPESAVSEVFAGLPTQQDVRQLVGRQPTSEEKTLSELRETYSWRGAFRSYHLYVYYARGAKPAVSRVVLNQPDDAAPTAAAATGEQSVPDTSMPGGGGDPGSGGRAPDLKAMSKMAPQMPPEALDSMSEAERKMFLEKMGKGKRGPAAKGDESQKPGAKKDEPTAAKPDPAKAGVKPDPSAPNKPVQAAPKPQS
jgi:hypothetical protein